MNTHEWIEEQRTLIDNGIAAATIRLEGVDETAWGTWPIALEGLADRIDATIATLADDLPKGRHNLRLLALDAKQLQIACRPLTITGKSAAASQAISDHVSISKALALNVQMSEQQIASASIRAENAEKRALEAMSGAFEIFDAFLTLKQKIMLEEIEAEDRRAKREMMADLAREGAPIIRAVAEAVAEKIMNSGAATPPKPPENT